MSIDIRDPLADAFGSNRLRARSRQLSFVRSLRAARRTTASHPGFSYSSAMSASHEPWEFAQIYVFLKAPQLAVPGTKMSYAGLRSSQDRIDLLAYLRTQSDSPLEIPPKK